MNQTTVADIPMGKELLNLAIREKSSSAKEIYQFTRSLFYKGCIYMAVVLVLLAGLFWVCIEDPDCWFLFHFEIQILLMIGLPCVFVLFLVMKGSRLWELYKIVRLSSKEYESLYNGHARAVFARCTELKKTEDLEEGQWRGEGTYVALDGTPLGTIKIKGNATNCMDRTEEPFCLIYAEEKCIGIYSTIVLRSQLEQPRGNAE